MIPLNIEAFKCWVTRFMNGSNKKMVLIILAGVVTVISIALSGFSSTPPSVTEAGSALFYLSVFAKLCGVLMLVIGGSVLFRKWQGKLPGGKLERQLAIIESVRLSPRQSLYLIRAGDRQLVIGATDQGIALISEIKPVKAVDTEPFNEAEIEFPYIFRSLAGQPSVEKFSTTDQL